MVDGVKYSKVLELLGRKVNTCINLGIIYTRMVKFQEDKKKEKKARQKAQAVGTD